MVERDYMSIVKAVILAVSMTGCGGEEYDMDLGPEGPCVAKPECRGADNRHEFDGTYYDALNCDWYCKNNQWVSKTWEPRSATCWVLTSSSTSTPLVCR